MLCWWCCHNIDGAILNLPLKYDEHRKHFTTLGYFCSWECMKAFSIDEYGINRGGLINSNIAIMRREMEGKLSMTRRAPSRFLLDVFGGPLSIQEFRNNTNITKPLKNPNGVHVIQSVNVTASKYVGNQPNGIQQNNEQMLDKIYSTTGKNESLKLRRTKPTKTNQSGFNLEDSLGLIRTPHPQA